MVLGPLTLDTRTLGTQTQILDPLCLPPTYLATTLPDLLVKTYDASKVLNEMLESFDAIGVFLLGNLARVDVAELPELFQLKCLSPALEARPHLNGNNSSIPRI
jgi:hypothetical protein